MVNAIGQEIRSRRDYINETIETIYFGGGTPSLLTKTQFEHLLTSIKENFRLGDSPEITLEANPEDLTPEKASAMYKQGINRLSVGVQTFNEEKLTWMNRVHSSTEAKTAYENARAVGFDNISLDLIYAIPDHDRSDWEKDLSTIVQLDPEHISLYGLTIEDKTVFGKWEKENRLIQVPEDEAAAQYLLAIDFLKRAGFVQYEVSNFGKEGFYSRHNNAYWSGVPYLGVGPGAHSFNGTTRSFNVRNNPKYIKAIKEGLSYSETEQLSDTQRLNEQILTQLRTAKGLDLIAIEERAGESLLKLHSGFIDELREKDLVATEGNYLRLKSRGFLVADEIALRLFFPE